MDGWVVNGGKMWISGMHRATHCIIFARTHGKAGDATGITAFFIPRDAPGFEIESYEWTFNMVGLLLSTPPNKSCSSSRVGANPTQPTDHATLSLNDVLVPASAVLGTVGQGLAIAQTFVHENRLRQAASSLGAAEYCIEESVKYARKRKPFGKELSTNQSIQFPLVELSTQAEMLKLLILKTATEMDKMTQKEIERNLGDKVSMCNVNSWGSYNTNRVADETSIGGIGFVPRQLIEPSRHMVIS